MDDYDGGLNDPTQNHYGYHYFSISPFPSSISMLRSYQQAHSPICIRLQIHSIHQMTCYLWILLSMYGFAILSCSYSSCCPYFYLLNLSFCSQDLQACSTIYLYDALMRLILGSSIFSLLQAASSTHRYQSTPFVHNCLSIIPIAQNYCRFLQKIQHLCITVCLFCQHILQGQALSFWKSGGYSFSVSLSIKYINYIDKYTSFRYQIKQSRAIMFQCIQFRFIYIILIKKQIPSKTMGKKTHQQSSNGKGANKNPSNESENAKIDKKLIQAEQGQLKVLAQNADKNGKLEKFDKMKYKQIIYETGEFLHLFSGFDNLPYIVRLQEILKAPGDHNVPKGFIKVQWLLRKQDLPKKFQQYLNCFSTAQVFPSGQYDYVYIESILSKCNVLSYQQYEFLQNTGSSIHFTRAIYNKKTNSLLPPIQQWQKTCYCNTPPNPDLAYTQCEKCEVWIHNQCIGDRKITQCEQFICKNCYGKASKKRK